MNVIPPLDEAYFEWLCRQVRITKNRNPARSYLTLLKKLYTTPFIWFVRNDDNRAADGIELRDNFLDEMYEGAFKDHDWLELECSLLEMLVGLAKRAAYQSLDEPDRWFWVFIENLGMRSFSDGLFKTDRNLAAEVDGVLDALNMRTYFSNGTGGLFPLKDPEDDQRTVELWYQLSAYLQEGG